MPRWNMKNSCSLLTLWTQGQLVKTQTVFSGQHKCAGRFVWGDGETITGGDRGRNTSCWRDLFVAVDLFTTAVCEEPSARPLTGSRSNLAYPYGKSSLSFLSAGPTPEKTSHKSNRWLRRSGSMRDSGLVLGGRGEMDLTQRDCAELPKVQTFCMCIYLSNDCWQSAQELLLDVGAALILKPTKPEGVSVRLVTTAEKKLHTHWGGKQRWHVTER